MCGALDKKEIYTDSEKQKRQFLQKAFICFLCFFCIIINSPLVFAGNPYKIRVLSSAKGTSVIYTSSSYSKNWTANHLFDQSRSRGWRSKDNSSFPHVIIFRLAKEAKINHLRFNNETQEAGFPGISTKEISVEVSTSSSLIGYAPVGRFILEQGKRLEEFAIPDTKARWIRLTILSNYGHPNYTELREFEVWEFVEFKILPVIPHLLWIMGAALMLTAFSYKTFFSCLKKFEKSIPVKSSHFRNFSLLGLFLFAVGLCSSLQKIWLAVLSTSFVTILALWFVIKSKEKLFLKITGKKTSQVSQ